MTEDRLEKALDAMKSEDANPEQLDGARARVWEKLRVPGLALCAEFQPGFDDYLAGQLAENRRVLMEDHLSRCPRCRAQLAELKGERKVIAMPRGRSWWPRWGTWAAAAAVILVALYLGRASIDTLMAPGGPRATVASVTGGLYRVPEGVLQAGAALGEDEVVRTGPGARAVLRLADGSQVEVNERTELFVRAVWSGESIYLQRGDIIVQAAKQHRGHLRVLTRDSVASVKGTVFAVSSGLGGTIVSVVEGSVEVARPGGGVLLKAGEQASSNPALSSSVRNAVSWSPDAQTYTALLDSFAKIEKQLAELLQPALRTQSALIQYLPANVVVYGAVPNLGGTIDQAMGLFEQQSAQNPAFRDWWNSGSGQELRQLIDRIQTLTPLLGAEVVFALSSDGPGMTHSIPMCLAEVQPGKEADLAAALSALASGTGATPPPYHLTNSLIVVSDSQANLDWVVGRLGQGAATPFAQAIAARYARGAGWLFGVDVESSLPAIPVNSGADFTGASQVKHVFFDQRSVQGAEENEVTLTFRGPRTGLASWLADGGSGGAAEYISSDAVFASYVSIREPRQLYDELVAQLAKLEPTLNSNLAEAEAKLGVNFGTDLAAAFGTESAFALDGLSVTGPVWMMTMLVNDPIAIDNSIRKLADAFNAQLGPEDQAKRVTLQQETVDGRVWTTVKSSLIPLAVTWTYDRGYLVAASDRGEAARAIATRNGGSALVWSPSFQQQLPSSSSLHPSGFAWLNTKGALQGLAALISNPVLQKLMTERDPVLAVFDGSTEQIHAASRTRLSGLLMDMMLLQNLGRTSTGTPAATLRQGRPRTGIR